MMKKILFIFIIIFLILATKITSVAGAVGEVVVPPCECSGAGMGRYSTTNEQFINYDLIPYLNGESDKLFLNKYFDSKCMELLDPPFDRLNDAQKNILISEYKNISQVGVFFAELIYLV